MVLDYAENSLALSPSLPLVLPRFGSFSFGESGARFRRRSGSRADDKRGKSSNKRKRVVEIAAADSDRVVRFSVISDRLAVERRPREPFRVPIGLGPSGSSLFRRPNCLSPGQRGGDAEERALLLLRGWEKRGEEKNLTESPSRSGLQEISRPRVPVRHTSRA